MEGRARVKPVVVLYGPFPQRHRVGGYERSNQTIVDSRVNDTYSIIPVGIFSFRLTGMMKRLLYPFSFAAGCIVDPLRIAIHGVRDRARVLHVTSLNKWFSPREFLVIWVAKRTGYSVVFDIRAGSFIDKYESSNRVLRWLLRVNISRSDAITVEGLPYIPYVREQFGREAEYLPNFVNTDGFSPGELARADHNGCLRLFFSGRIIPQKGVELLLDAVSDVAQRRELRLYLAGSVERDYLVHLSEKYAQLISRDCVRFRGILGLEELYATMAKMHVFVFPTMWKGEGHSNAVNEAMYLGLPVIVTRHGFLADIVDPDCGIILDEPSKEALVQAIERLHENADEREQMGRRAREKVLNYYTDRVVMKTLMGIYGRLSGGSGEARER
jgi:glycosyltransferase involved in cell wall biosynthesis